MLKFSPTGRLLAPWITETSYSGEFDAVHGIALDAGGNIYVSGSDTVRNSHILKLSPTGRRLAEWGTGGTGAGQFLIPRDVGVDGQGNVYVNDTGNRRIQKLSPTGKPLAQWTFDAPILAVDAQWHVYMTDGGPCCPARLFKFSSTGTLLDTWNVPGTIQGVSVVWPDKIYVWGYVGYASNLHAAPLERQRYGSIPDRAH